MTYIVAQDGSGDFNTVQAAADVARNPGDTVLIRSGNYAPFQVKYSGSQDGYISFKNYPGERPIIDGTLSSGKGIILGHYAGASQPIGWIVVEGLEVSHASQEGFKGYKIHHVVIRNCSFHHSNEENMLISGSHHVTLDGNSFYGAAEHDLYATGNYWTVSNNIFFGADHRIMQLYPYQVSGMSEFKDVTHWKIFNNVFAFNRFTTGLCLSSYDANPDAVGVTRGIEIYNNIFYQNAGAAINLSNAHPNIKEVSIHDNIHYGNGTFIGGGTHPDTEYVAYSNHYVDPQFIRIDQSVFVNNDFHLQSTSSAIDTGIEARDINGNLVSFDKDGNLRPQGVGWDVGAYEYLIPTTFADVPYDHWAYDEIEALYQAGYTAGCNTDPLMYCPNDIMNRAESAVFVERGVHGVGFEPTAPSVSSFDDVPVGYWGSGWIESLWEDGYTTGCGTDPLMYCPLQEHTRAEGCVFYLRMLHGVDYEPPAAEGVFVDVPVGWWGSGWVEAAVEAGLIEPCEMEPELRFCPHDPLDRALAAYMMVQAKGLE